MFPEAMTDLLCGYSDDNSGRPEPQGSREARSQTQSACTGKDAAGVQEQAPLSRSLNHCRPCIQQKLALSYGTFPFNSLACLPVLHAGEDAAGAQEQTHCLGHLTAVGLAF